MPPRLSTGSTVSFTCAGTNSHREHERDHREGSVTRNTDPHQKCWSSPPATSGPSAEIARRAPTTTRSARPAGPVHSAVISASVVGYAMPAARPPPSRAAKSTVVGGVRGEQAQGHRERDSEQQHHLAPVAVAEGTEVQHRRGEPERVADRDQIERGLRGVERLADIGKRDVGDREVQVRDRGYEDQRQQHELRPRRSVGGPRVVGHRYLSSRRSASKSRRLCDGAARSASPDGGDDVRLPPRQHLGMDDLGRNP